MRMMKRPLTKCTERLMIFRRAMQFAKTRAFAMEMAKAGNRDAARFWGRAARADWRAVSALLNS